MKRRMIERTNERTIKQMNEWMNEWMDTRKREYTDEQRNESKKSKYKEWNTLHSWFYLIVPKLPYRVVGLEDFGCDTVNLLDLPQGSVIFLWPPLVGSSLVVNILHFFLYTLLKTNDTPSFPPEYHAPHPPPPPPPPPDSPPPLLSRQMMSGLQEKNMIRHDTLKIHYLDTHCMWKHTPGN